MITARDAMLSPMAHKPAMTPIGSDVEAFLDAIPDMTRRTDAHQLCALMVKVTGEPPMLWSSSIVGFGSELIDRSVQIRRGVDRAAHREP